MNMINKNEIKKELYKRKPIAEYSFSRDMVWHYSTELTVGGVEEIIKFAVPVEEMGENIFEKELPAQLLIRWMI